MLSKLASWLSLDVTSGHLKRCSIFAFGITLTYVDEICQNFVVTSHLPNSCLWGSLNLQETVAMVHTSLHGHLKIYIQVDFNWICWEILYCYEDIAVLTCRLNLFFPFFWYSAWMFLVAFPMISLTSALCTDVTDYEAVPSLGQLVLTLWVGEHWQALATDIRDLTKRRDELEAELNEVRVMSLTGNAVPIHTILNL